MGYQLNTHQQYVKNRTGRVEFPKPENEHGHLLAPKTWVYKNPQFCHPKNTSVREVHIEVHASCTTIFSNSNILRKTDKMYALLGCIMALDRCGLILQTVAWSVTIVNPAKTVETITMPVGVWTLVGPRNYKMGSRSPCKRETLRGKRGGPL